MGGFILPSIVGLVGVPLRPATSMIGSSSSALSMAIGKSTAAKVAQQVLADPAIKASALAFFQGIRIPSTLIAGSSLAALFTMTELAARGTNGMSKTQVLVLRLYHGFALFSLCLSLSTIVTTTSASTMLLLQKYHACTAGCDVYHFLKSAMNFEFVFTRFCFLSSLISFVLCITCRLLIEFGLLTHKRRLAGVMVTASMSGLVCSMISYINTSLNCWPSLLEMAKEVAEMIWKRTLTKRHPMQMLSLGLFAVAALCSIRFLLPDSVEHDQLVDDEGYI